MAMLIEQAGGAASTGRGRILDVAPDGAAPARAGDPRLDATRSSASSATTRSSTAARSRSRSPLFNERSLFGAVDPPN